MVVLQAKGLPTRLKPVSSVALWLRLLMVKGVVLGPGLRRLRLHQGRSVVRLGQSRQCGRRSGVSHSRLRPSLHFHHPHSRVALHLRKALELLHTVTFQ